MLKMTWLFLPVFVSVLGAQQVQRPKDLRDSSAARVIAEIRELRGRVDQSRITEILRQKGKPQPTEKLDAIANELTSLTISSSQGRSDYTPYFVVLVGSGEKGNGGTAYSGLYARLVKIHKEASGEVRALSLYHLVHTGNQQALSYLRSVATSNDETALQAVNALLRATYERDLFADIPSAIRSEAELIARDLAVNRLVVNPAAAEILRDHAQIRGWIR